MKKTILITAIILMAGTLTAQWYPQTSGTNENINSVCFIDTLNGWAAGSNGIILHTNDGGDSWKEQTSGTNNYLRSVCFTDSIHGWIVGGSPYWWNDTGTILRTINGGDSWEKVDYPDLSTRNDVFFINSLKGWAIGHYGILHTTDGGVTWETQLGLSPDLHSVFFTDSLTGWVSGGYTQGSTGAIKSYILHSNDGGNTWTYQFEYSSRYGYILFDICFADSLNGWTAGGGWSYLGRILKTNDGGNNWDTCYYDTTYYGNPGIFYALSFADQFNGWAVGQTGRIISTTDGGNTWDTVPSGTNKNLTNVYFTENGYGWAVGDSGTILHADYSQTVGLDEFEVQSSKSRVRCYPNPFSTSTTIEYEIQHPSQVQVSFYNHTGKQIEVIRQNRSAGKQQVVWNAEGLPAGVYYCVLKTHAGRQESGIQTLKMIKLK